MKLRLEIEVEHDLSSEDGEAPLDPGIAEDCARHFLYASARHLFTNGLITQESSLTVESWDTRVVKLI